MPADPSGIFVVGLEDTIGLAETVLGGVWMDPFGSTTGPFDLEQGSPK